MAHQYMGKGRRAPVHTGLVVHGRCRQQEGTQRKAGRLPWAAANLVVGTSTTSLPPLQLHITRKWRFLRMHGCWLS